MRLARESVEILIPMNITAISAPKNTPADLIDRLNKETNAVLADPAAKTRFAELGALLLPGSAADFGKLLADETDKWGKVVKFSGARVD